MYSQCKLHNNLFLYIQLLVPTISKDFGCFNFRVDITLNGSLHMHENENCVLQTMSKALRHEH